MAGERNEYGVIVAPFKDDLGAHEPALVAAVDDLFAKGYSRAEIQCALCDIITCRISSNQLHRAMETRSMERRKP